MAYPRYVKPRLDIPTVETLLVSAYTPTSPLCTVGPLVSVVKGWTMRCLLGARADLSRRLAVCLAVRSKGETVVATTPERDDAGRVLCELCATEVVGRALLVVVLGAARARQGLSGADFCVAVESGAPPTASRRRRHPDPGRRLRDNASSVRLIVAPAAAVLVEARYLRQAH